MNIFQTATLSSIRPPAAHRLDIAIAVGLMLLTALPYLQVLQFDFVALDDYQYVTESELVPEGLDPLTMWGALTEFHADNWHPVVWWSLMLDHQLFGMNAGAFHQTNLLLHIATTILLFAALSLLTGDRWQSAFAAAIFGVHPVHVESVAWISERKDVLSGAFWMLGLWCYARWHSSGNGVWKHGVTISLVLGLMSKQTLVAFPLVLLLLDFWPLRRWHAPDSGVLSLRRIRQACLEKLPWLFLCVVAAVLAMQAQTTARSAASDWPLRLRLSNAVVSLVRYLSMIAWPVDLGVQYTYNPPSLLTQVLPSCVVIVAGSVLAVALSRARPALTVGWFWFLIGLLPTLGLIQAGRQPLADRYLYLPLIGLLIALIWSWPSTKNSWSQWIRGGAAGLILLALSLRTAQQTSTWRDTVTLMNQALAVDQTNENAHYVLGSLALTQSDWQQGVEHLQEAVHWDRSRWQARRLYAGNVAPREFDELNRRWAYFYLQLAEARLALGQQSEAQANLDQALQLDPALEVADQLRSLISVPSETEPSR